MPNTGDLKGIRIKVDYENGKVIEPGGLPWLEVLVPEEGEPMIYIKDKWVPIEKELK